MGLKLGRVLDAGLPTPRMLLAARVERGPDCMVYEQVAQITRTLLPLMEQTSVASREAVDIETLADRLREEALGATLIAPSLISAWTQRP